MNWIRPYDQLTIRTRAEADDALARYRAYCAVHGLLINEPTSAHEYAASLVRYTSRKQLRRTIQHLRRLFLDDGLADPFTSTAARKSQMDALIARAQPTQECRAYSSRTYHNVIDSLPDTDIGLRDAAIIALIYAGRLRGYDIHGLDPEHVTFSAAGLRADLVLARKRAPLVMRRLIDPLYCPVALLERWFRVIDFTAPGFRSFNKSRVRPERMSYDAVRWAVRQRLLRVGECGTAITSLKGTMIAVAAMRGADDASIRGQGGCRTDTTIAKWKARAHVGTSTQRLGL